MRPERSGFGVLVFKPDGDEYLLKHGIETPHTFRASEYGIRRLIADYGATFEKVSKGGWYHYRLAEPVVWTARPARQCIAPGCNELVPPGSQSNRRYHSRRCKNRIGLRRLYARQKAARIAPNGIGGR